MIRSFLVALVSLTGMTFFRLWLKKKKGSLVRVLAYHDIGDISKFEKQIDFLDKKFNVISPQEFESNMFGEERINVLLTFDDGYGNWIEAEEVLRKRALGGIFFLSSGFVESSGNEEMEERYSKENLDRSRKLEAISWNAVRDMLSKNPYVFIGGHTKGHKKLSKLEGEELREEIEGDKELIEKKVDRVIMYFAYPYGRRKDILDEAIKAVSDAGYRYAFTTEFGFAREDETKRYVTPRTQVETDFPNWFLHLWVSGAWDFFKH